MPKRRHTEEYGKEPPEPATIEFMGKKWDVTIRNDLVPTDHVVEFTSFASLARKYELVPTEFVATDWNPSTVNGHLCRAADGKMEFHPSPPG